MTVHVDLDDLLAVVRAVVGESAIRDHGLLESALARPRASVSGQDAYPSQWEKAAALLHSLARNHALLDGNKRVAWVAAGVFLGQNGIYADTVDVDDAEALVVAVARGDLDVPDIAKELRRLIG